MLPITWIPSGGANLFDDEAMLPETVGVNVVDAEPGAGVLRPLKARVTVATVPTSPQRNTIYRMGRDTPNDALYWFSWSAIVNAIRGFDKTDPTERTYYSGDGTPKWTDNTIALGAAPYPQASRELAVPAPDTAATITEASAGSGTDETRYYVHTFVNELGWESAPSPVSAGFTCKPGCVLNITGLPAAPAGNYGITVRRIYRTQSGATGNAEYFFLREVAIGTTSTTDDGRALGDALATVGWIVPPAAGHSLIALWSGMYGMLSGKTAHISPVGIPYAFPVRYDIELQSTGVTCLKWEQNWLILTTGAPVLVQGQDPDGMVDQQLRNVWPCASKRSAVSMGDGAVWWSNEGLASTYSDRLLTERLVKPEQWKAWNPSTAVAGRWGRFYVCSFNDGTRRGFMIDPKNPGGGLWFLSAGFDACDYDELADQLYVLEGGNVRKFNAGSAMTATARSKVFKQTRPTSFKVAKVIATGYPVTFSLYTERVNPVTQAITRVLRFTKTVLNANAFTIPHGFSAEDWQPEVSSVHTVKAVRLANDVRQLKGL